MIIFELLKRCGVVSELRSAIVSAAMFAGGAMYVRRNCWWGARWPATISAFWRSHWTANLRMSVRPALLLHEVSIDAVVNFLTALTTSIMPDHYQSRTDLISTVSYCLCYRDCLPSFSDVMSKVGAWKTPCQQLSSNILEKHLQNCSCWWGVARLLCI